MWQRWNLSSPVSGFISTSIIIILFSSRTRQTEWGHRFGNCRVNDQVHGQRFSCYRFLAVAVFAYVGIQKKKQTEHAFQ